MRVKRVTGLDGLDQRQLPPVLKPVPFKGQIVDAIQDETLAGVEIRKAAISLDIVAILNYQSLLIAGVVVNGFRVRIGPIELESLRKTLLSSEPEAVVR